MSKNFAYTILAARGPIGWSLALLVLAGCSSDDSSQPDASPSPDAMGVADVSRPPDTSVSKDAGGGGDADATTPVADAADSSSAEASGDASGDASDGGVSNDAEAGVALTGHLLIADQFNNRVIEIDRQGNIVWQFGDGKAVASATSIVAPNDCERLPNGQTLMAGTGTIVGVGDPACDMLDAGPCSDNRVMVVNPDGGIAWQYSALSAPVFAAMLASGNVLITDQGNARIVEVTPDGGIAWQFGPQGGDAGSVLNNPNSAQRLDGGNTLIADESNMRILEVRADGGTVWEFAVPDSGQPAFASRLPSGNTLITDGTNNRVLEVAPDGGIVWTYSTVSAALADAAPPGPSRAVRLANQHTLIANQFYHQVFEIDDMTPPNVVFTYGQLGVPGNDAGQLNAPYDSKVIGDFTGLTPPQ